MEESGLPAFIVIVAMAVMIVGVVVGMAAVTWVMLFAAAA
jgi:hypothetical protein